MPLTEKQILRAEMKKRRSSTENKKEKSDCIFRNVIGSKEYNECERLFAYVSINDEPRTAELIDFALKQGKKVFLPKCENSNGDMTFRASSSLSQLKMGFFSIPEPSDSAYECHQTYKTDLCVVPGIAFDKKGNRIGYGKGYYDRFLSDFHGFTLGLCFSDCFIDKIPREDNDIALSAVCTEKKLFYIR